MSSDDLLREKAEFEHILDSCLSTSECDYYMMGHMINHTLGTLVLLLIDSVCVGFSVQCFWS